MALSRLLPWCVVASALLISTEAPAAESSPTAPKPAPLAAPTAKPKIAPAPSPASPIGVVSYGRTPAQLRIESVLNKPLKAPLSFVHIPISELARVIVEDYDIPLIIDSTALKASGLTPDEEVTIEIGNVSLKSALSLLLKSASDGAMTYIIDDEVLLFTTSEVAAKRLQTRIYPVDQLTASLQPAPRLAVAKAAANTPPADPTTDLAEALILTISPDSWRRNGGRGDVQKLGDKYLVVLQSHAVHEEIENFLRQLAQAIAMPTAAVPQQTR